MQQKVFDLLLEQDDVSWKSILMELVEKEQMDPWDIDITLLTKKYIKVIKELQQQDFRISGKILLAAAFLLKIKSAHLVDHDIFNLDKLINQAEAADDDELFEDLENGQSKLKEKYQLIHRNPQPRNRKVSLQELIDSLQRAMVSKRRILAKQRPVKFDMPKRRMDIMGVIRELYHKIVYFTQKENKDRLTFTQLLPPKAGRTEKVYTFIPMLHLEHQEKIVTEQAKPFDEIYIQLLKKNKAAEN